MKGDCPECGSMEVDLYFLGEGPYTPESFYWRADCEWCDNYNSQENEE